MFRRLRLSDMVMRDMAFYSNLISDKINRYTYIVLHAITSVIQVVTYGIIVPLVIDALLSISTSFEQTSLFKKRTSKENGLSKRPQPPPSASYSSDYSSSKEGQRKAKRQLKNGIVTVGASIKVAKQP